LRDLEIRGAGNILGPAQSGHIAAVGYNLYCRLLARAAARLKGEPLKEPPAVNVNIGLDAFLPEEYVPTPRQRMDFHREINRATELAELRATRRALEDRFGPLPQDAANLLGEAEIRILAARAGIDSIHVEDGRLHFGVRDEEALNKASRAAPVAPRMVAAGLAVLDDGFPSEDPVALCAFLRDMLRRR
jgi:transcription-repair coupling factor (superfamily II helicase)